MEKEILVTKIIVELRERFFKAHHFESLRSIIYSTAGYYEEHQYAKAYLCD